MCNTAKCQLQCSGSSSGLVIVVIIAPALSSWAGEERGKGNEKSGKSWEDRNTELWGQRVLPSDPQDACLPLHAETALNPATDPSPARPGRCQGHSRWPET